MTSSPHPQAITPTAAPRTATPSRRPRRCLATLAAAAATATALALTGCTAAPSATGPGTSSADATAAPAAARKTPIDLPATPLGEQAAWILAALNDTDHDGTPAATAAAVEERLAPATLTEITPAQLLDVFSQLGATAPWAPTAIQDAGSEALITITDTAGDSLDLQLSLDAGDRIAGLLFGPSAADRVPATTWDELSDAADSFAADTHLAVTELAAEGTATRILDAGKASAERALPSGSMFKLYVLAATADAIAAGRLAWETPLTLTDDLKSLPSGELQNEPAGTQVTVQDAASAMIEISDNTATDLLIDAVGASAVEQAFADLGHHDPALNTPLLTTRALFELGWGGPDGDGGEAHEAWVAAAESGTGTGDVEQATAARRDILNSLPTGLPDVEVTNVTTPVWQDGLDWFTTADDLVAVHEGLQQRAATPAGEPLRAILAKNPGLGDTFGDAWSYAAFKGGGSIGVLAGSWYLERADGRRFVISIQGRSDDPAALADQAGFFGQVQDAVALLEQE